MNAKIGAVAYATWGLLHLVATFSCFECPQTNAGETVFNGELPRSANFGFRVQRQEGAEKLVVTHVDTESAAWKAGLREDDLVLSINNAIYQNALDGQNQLQRVAGNRELTLRKSRDDREETIRFTPPAMAPENVEGVDTVYDELKTADGAHLRTILTRPEGSKTPLPAILFVDWVACNSVEVPETLQGGWAHMMRGVMQKSGMVMMRTEKSGVGDSLGPACSELDYLTNLEHHKEALKKLASYDFVDSKRIVIFGASNGATMAPLVAEGQKVAGVITWGGGARTWFERMMAFERNFRERSGLTGAEINRDMKDITRFFFHYLVEQQDPRQIIKEKPELARIWQEEVHHNSPKYNTHYGRPVIYHQQAQQMNWAGAWDKVTAPVLVMFGEYDWFEDAGGTALVERVINARNPGQARYVQFPKMNHHFEIYSTAEQAVLEEAYDIAPLWAVDAIVGWLNDVVRK